MHIACRLLLLNKFNRHDRNAHIITVVIMSHHGYQARYYVNCSYSFVIVFSLCMSFCAIHLQMYMSPKLSVIALSIVPPIALLSRVYGRYVQNITKQVQDSLAGATQVTVTFSYESQNNLHKVLDRTCS